MDFAGRERELGLLRKRLDRVAATGTGTALAIRGRRQVGKSRLVQEFCDRAGVPYVYSTATKGASPVEAVAEFLSDVAQSTLVSDRDLVPRNVGGSWRDALAALAANVPDSPSVVVLDELPWLAEQDVLFEGTLQTAWDRLLASRPVLLLLLGSDIHMMERLSAHDRPFYGRADNLVLGPLDLAETASATGLGGADAIDAHLAAGGLPGVLRSWPSGMDALAFIEQECDDPASPLFGVPEASLLAEFPVPDQARRVLEAVGAGERTHANIAAAAGSARGAIASGSLSPLLRSMVEDKRVLALDQPLSTRPGKPGLYRVDDTNLRLYLGVLRVAHELSRRGRAEAAFEMVRRRWTSWRGRAVEPLIRASIELACADGTLLPWTETRVVGGWWNRQFDPEIDIVGADRAPVADSVVFAGSTKWLGTPFDGHDLSTLTRATTQLPGFVAGRSGTIVVSLSGVTPDVQGAADVVWGPDDMVDVWR
jgi:uncharacterized protein